MEPLGKADLVDCQILTLTGAGGRPRCGRGWDADSEW